MLSCNETGLNVSKILQCILRKAIRKKLIVAGNVPETIVSLVSGDNILEVSARCERHKLSKYGFPVNMGRKIKWSVQSCGSSHVHEITL